MYLLNCVFVGIYRNSYSLSRIIFCLCLLHYNSLPDHHDPLFGLGLVPLPFAQIDSCKPTTTSFNPLLNVAVRSLRNPSKCPLYPPLPTTMLCYSEMDGTNLYASNLPFKRLVIMAFRPARTPQTCSCRNRLELGQESLILYVTMIPSHHSTTAVCHSDGCGIFSVILKGRSDPFFQGLPARNSPSDRQFDKARDCQSQQGISFFLISWGHR